jgi:hypothetical protein
MVRFAKVIVAIALVLTGLYLALFGNAWGPWVFELLPDSEIGSWVELIVPFLPLAFIGAGAVLYTRNNIEQETK